MVNKNYLDEKELTMNNRHVNTKINRKKKCSTVAMDNNRKKVAIE